MTSENSSASDVATHAPVRRWTYEELAALPDDGNFYEIIAGDLYIRPRSAPGHGWVASQIAFMIGRHLDKHGLDGWLTAARIGLLLGETDYLEPDAVFVRPDREGIITDRAIEGAPDLVIEVISDVTAARDRGIKRERYARYGVPEYWIVDVDRRHVEVYRPRPPDVDALPRRPDARNLAGRVVPRSRLAAAEVMTSGGPALLTTFPPPPAASARSRA